MSGEPRCEFAMPAACPATNTFLDAAAADAVASRCGRGDSAAQVRADVKDKLLSKLVVTKPAAIKPTTLWSVQGTAEEASAAVWEGANDRPTSALDVKADARGIAPNSPAASSRTARKNVSWWDSTKEDYFAMSELEPGDTRERLDAELTSVLLGGRTGPLSFLAREKRPLAERMFRGVMRGLFISVWDLLRNTQNHALVKDVMKKMVRWVHLRHLRDARRDEYRFPADLDSVDPKWLATAPAQSPELLVVHRLEVAALNDALRILSKREALVLGHWLEGKPWDKLSIKLGVTQARLCQLRLQAVNTLREQLFDGDGWKVNTFLDKLESADLAAVKAALDVVSEDGLAAARHLGEEIYEVRAKGSRAIYRVLFADDQETKNFVLLALLQLVGNEVDAAEDEIDAAERRLKDYRLARAASTRRRG